MFGSRKDVNKIDPNDPSNEEVRHLLADDELGTPEDTSPSVTTNSSDTVLEVASFPDERSQESDELTGCSTCLSLTGKVAKYSSVYAIAAIASAPTALNAFAAPSGQGPEHIGSEWWNSMSLFRQIYSVCSGISSEVVNTIMNALFIPLAWQKLCESFAGFRQLPTALQGSVAILLSLGAAIAAGAIAYTSFLWLPISQLSLLPTIISFIITFAGRFISVKSIFSRIRTLFSKDGRLQKQYADKLAHINDAHLQEVQDRLQQIITECVGPGKNLDEPLTEDEYQKVIVALGAVLDELNNNNDLINNTTTREALLSYLGLLIDVAMCISGLVPTFMTYTQKGFDGVNILSKMISGTSLDNINQFAKAAIGALPGVPSAMFFASAGMDFRANMSEMFKYVYKTPKTIPAMLGLFIVNGIACNSMSNLAQSTISHPGNIFGLGNNAYGTTYLALQTSSGFVTNMNSCVVKAFLTSPDPAARDVTVEHLSRRTSNENHPIAPATAESLRKFKLFTPKPAASTPVQREDTRIDFGPGAGDAAFEF